MTNTALRDYADQLADLLMRMDDLKVEAKALIDAAKEEGINVKALRKIAKELATDSDKLAAKYEDEQQLELFRTEVKIRARKGIDKVVA